MRKNERHQLILAIIQERNLSTQEELVEELKKKGLLVTQATVSRDINSLKLFKEPLEGGAYYKLPNNHIKEVRISQNSLESVIRDYVTHINYVCPIMVLRTLPGGAATVAFYLDGEENEGIAGTIAGDDTIFVALLRDDLAEVLLRRWKGWMS